LRGVGHVSAIATGIFRAQITGYGLRDADGSQSVGVVLQVLLLEMWNGQEWDEWEQYDMEATGTLWIVKKRRDVNQSAKVEDLAEARGLGRDVLDRCSARPGSRPSARWSVKRGRLQGRDPVPDRVRQRRTTAPWAVSTSARTKAASWPPATGPGLRAIAANVKRNGAAPAAPPASSRPSPPPNSSRPTPPPPASQGEDIPF
jgi:hypothetical protein